MRLITKLLITGLLMLSLPLSANAALNEQQPKNSNKPNPIKIPPIRLNWLRRFRAHLTGSMRVKSLLNVLSNIRNPSAISPNSRANSASSSAMKALLRCPRHPYRLATQNNKFCKLAANYSKFHASYSKNLTVRVPSVIR